MKKFKKVRETIQLNQIVLVEGRAQRMFDQRKLANMTGEHFDWRAVGTIYLSRQGDGTYHPIDGQHRWKALQIEGYTEWECDVYSDLTFADEWVLFNRYNGQRTNPTKLTFHKSYAEEGRSGGTLQKAIMAREIDEAVEAEGFFIPQCADRNPNALVSIDAIESVWKMGGKDLVQTVCKIIRSAWGDDDDRLRRGRSSGMVRGIGLTVSYHQEHRAFSFEHLIAVLEAFGPFKLDALASDIHERFQSEQVQRSYYRAILKRYNLGRRGGSLLRLQYRSPFTALRGENNRFATVSNETAEEIAQMILDGTSSADIQLKFQVSESTVKRIKLSHRYTRTMDQAHYGQGEVVPKILSERAESIG